METIREIWKKYRVGRRIAAVLLAILIIFSNGIETAFAAVGDTSVTAVSQQSLPQKGTVTGFPEAEDEELTVCEDDRPSENELVSDMPETISVYIGDAEQPVEMPVTWYCVSGDYDKASQHYYQYSPKWDTKRYPLAKGLEVEVDAPCVGVVVSEDSSLSTQSVTRSGNESTVYRFLIKEMGLSCAAACGVMANIQAESNFSPNEVYYGSTTFHGLIQWGESQSSGARWGKLKSWCKKHGYNYRSVTGQLRFMKYELETVSRYHYSALKKVSNSASGAYKAAGIFAKYYEGCSSIYFGIRQRWAKNKYWREYSPFSKVKVTVEADELMYTGKKVTPKFTVTLGTKTLVLGKDYTITYSNNINADKASYELTGKGSYCGVLLGEFTIQTEAPVLDEAKSTTSGVKVSWEAAPGAVGYRVYRKDGKKWVKVGDTTATTLTDKTAVSGETNTYTVCCITSGGVKASDYDKTGCSLDYVAAPSLTAKLTETGVKVSWKEVSGASSYRLMKKDKNGAWKEVATTSKTSFTDTKAGAVNEYRAVCLAQKEEILLRTDEKVVLYDAETAEEAGQAGEAEETEQAEKPAESKAEVVVAESVEKKVSSYSSTLTVKRLSTPSGLKATGGKKAVTLSWKKVSGASKYAIYRKKSGKWVKVAETSKCTWKDTSLKKKTSYSYTVACISKDGKTLESTYNTAGVTAKTK